jgi:DNA-binding MarR family transcriptional regulator
MYSPRMADLDEGALHGWRAFLTAHALITRAIGRELAAAGLPDLRWYDLLWSLYKAPGRSLRANELVREGVLTQAAMSRFVDRVEAAGCVRREVDPDDRRAQRVVLTDRGIELLRAMWPVYARGIEQHFAAHGGADLREALEAMAGSARSAGA